jgi:hypothetical protein
MLLWMNRSLFAGAGRFITGAGEDEGCGRRLGTDFAARVFSG